MPSTSKRRPLSVGRTMNAKRERQVQRKALRAQLREEREIQRMTKKLQREIQRTHDRYQELAAVLGSHARAIEAEREAAAALQG